MMVTPFPRPASLSIPSPNPLQGIHDWLSPRSNLLLGVGAGLLSGDLGNVPLYAMEGRKADTAYAEAEQAKSERQQALQDTQALRAKYADFFRQQNEPELADLVGNDQGPAPGDVYWKWRDLKAGEMKGADENFFGTLIKGYDEAGSPVYLQPGNHGSVKQLQLPEGFQPENRLEKVDLGDRWYITDTTTGQSWVIMKNGDVPTGFEQRDGGGIQPMPNSPQEREVIAGQTKATSALNSLEEKNRVVVDAIDKALGQSGFWTTGMMGSATSGIPGTPAFDLARTLDTIKANIGFGELQQMRDNSPTGGALGQVSERELAFLQSTITNIEQAQSQEQLQANLKLLRDYLSQATEQRREAFATQYGDNSQRLPATPASAGIDDLLAKYGVN